MRIGVTIGAIGVALLVALHAWSATTGSGFAPEEHATSASSVGWFVAVLCLVGAAFARPAPLIAALTFLLAGSVAFRVGAITALHEILLWGVLTWTLALTSVLGWVEQRRVRRRAIHRTIDAELVPTDPSAACPRCAAPAIPTAGVCESCGFALTAPPLR